MSFCLIDLLLHCIALVFSARANSIKGSVQQGTQKVAHGVVKNTKSAADHIQLGIQSGARVVASVPGNIANVVQEGQSSVAELLSSLDVSSCYIVTAN